MKRPEHVNGGDGCVGPLGMTGGAAGEAIQDATASAREEGGEQKLQAGGVAKSRRRPSLTVQPRNFLIGSVGNK